MPIAVYVLSIGAFAICTSEFVIMGLLPAVSQSLDVSLSQAGYLVTGYAMGVVVGAPVLTPIVSRLAPRKVLIGMMILFLIGNTLCALAPTYWMLLACRVATALAHASFFGIGSVFVTRLAPPGKQASAIATMFLGATVATIAGVPLGTAIGQSLGWRATFGLVSIAAAIALASIIHFVPDARMERDFNLRDEFHSLTRRSVLVSLLTTVFGNGGPFVLLTYISPYLTDVGGVQKDWLPAFLFIFGIGMMVGNSAGARLADQDSRFSIRVTVFFLILVLVAFAIVPSSTVSVGTIMFLFGAATFSVIPPLQTEVLLAAGSAPILAAATNIAAFNLGNAAGAWLGSITVGGRPGLAELPLVAAGFAALGLLLAIRPRQSLNSTAQRPYRNAAN